MAFRRNIPARMGYALLVALALSSAQCLGLEQDCTSGSTDCETLPVLATYLVLESLSFRPPACGTFGPASYVDRSDGLLALFATAGPVSLAPNLPYEAGFLNRPLHLIGCTPAEVKGSISVNAGPATEIREQYSYSNTSMPVNRRLTVGGANSFNVDVGYSATDYPTRIAGDCGNLPGESSVTQANYELFSRLAQFGEQRPENCDAGSAAGRQTSSFGVYRDSGGSPNYTIARVVETNAGVTTTIAIESNMTYTRDGANRLTRREQFDQIAITVSSPPTVNNGDRAFVFNYTYDENGRVTAFSGNRGAGTNATIHYGYDSAGRVVSMSSTGMQAGQAASSTDTFVYDRSGRISSHVSSFTLGANTTVINFSFSY